MENYNSFVIQKENGKILLSVFGHGTDGVIVDEILVNTYMNLKVGERIILSPSLIFHMYDKQLYPHAIRKIFE